MAKLSDQVLRLREFFMKENIKNAEICEKMNYGHPQDATNLKGGKVAMTPDLALELERHWKINPCWLFFGRGPMKTPVPSMDLAGGKEPMSYEDLYNKVDQLANTVAEMQHKYGD